MGFAQTLVVGALLASASTLSAAEINDAAVRDAGIRKIAGKHLILYTDLEPRAEIDVLPEIFDQAFPQWCDYFGLDAARVGNWRPTGFLMKDKSRFVAMGLLPDGLPPFEHGYSQRNQLWFYDQPSDYYRCHLLLHEGTHAFMLGLLGAAGPPWYMEGMAELLATHRWQDGRLTLNYFPASREEVPMWGRIKIVRDDFAARRAKTLRGVLQYGPEAHLKVGPYAWCWAAAALLDRHPKYRERFRTLHQFVRRPDFNQRFLDLLGDDWNQLAEEWQVFVADLEYGYDIPRTVLDFTPGQPLAESGATVTVAADRGWQNTGIRLEAGAPYDLRASGRYQVGNRPKIWWCEPNGVSLRYYRGRPLGMLLAAVRPDRPASGAPSPLIAPIPIGLGATLTPRQTGTLFLRINDSAGELGDNAGSLKVELRQGQAESTPGPSFPSESR